MIDDTIHFDGTPKNIRSISDFEKNKFLVAGQNLFTKVVQNSKLLNGITVSGVPDRKNPVFGHIIQYWIISKNRISWNPVMLTSDVITTFHPFSYQIIPKVGKSGSETGLQIPNSQNLPCMVTVEHILFHNFGWKVDFRKYQMCLFHSFTLEGLLGNPDVQTFPE